MAHLSQQQQLDKYNEEYQSVLAGSRSTTLPMNFRRYCAERTSELSIVIESLQITPQSVAANALSK